MKEQLTTQMLQQIDFSQIYPLWMLDGRVVETNPSAASNWPQNNVATSSSTVQNQCPSPLICINSFIDFWMTTDRRKRIWMTSYVMNREDATYNYKFIRSNPSQGDFEPGSFSGRQIGEETYVDKWRMEAPTCQFRMITLDGNVTLLIRLLGGVFDRRVHNRADYSFTNEEALWAEEFVIQTLKGFAKQGYTLVTQP